MLILSPLYLTVSVTFHFYTNGGRMGEMVELTWKELENPAGWKQLKPQLIGQLVAEQQLWKYVEHKPYLPTDQGKMQSYYEH